MKKFNTRVLLMYVLLALLIPVLFAADALCYTVALPVTIDQQGSFVILQVGSVVIHVEQTAPLNAIQFAPHLPVIHEYQLDGSDSTNNFSLDPVYMTTLSSTPYYRFQAWMRDLDGTSRWRNIGVWTQGHLITSVNWPSNGASIALPSVPALHLNVELQRPETPMTLNLIAVDASVIHVTIDRNNRRIEVTREGSGQASNLPPSSVYFPVDAAPFAAMVMDFLIRLLLWAIFVLLFVLLIDVWIGVLEGFWMFWRHPVQRVVSLWTSIKRTATSFSTRWYSRYGSLLRKRLPALLLRWWKSLTTALHPAALVALAASFLFVAWIAYVQYHGEPHIFDASAYLFAAKMYALGHLSVPLPPAADRFPGPFMLQFHGRWFAQYTPGTALTLVPGVWLGIPWLVEPLLGTFALLGIGLLADRLYTRSVATLAVLLGTLSPFYSYLAASYLSHTVALFYLVWALWAFVRFLQGKAGWNLWLSAVLFGMAGLTRDLVIVLFMVVTLPGLLVLSWRKVRWDWSHAFLPGLVFIATLLLFVGISFGFNFLLTGSWSDSPRSLFFAGDHWGFGLGVGFYGQHTLAAGLVNLDELLTILSIDLFGWPFYFTLLFLFLPFLTWRAIATDWLFFIIICITTSVWIGYFYHGIYLGPRYLFETLPFLLILTARGIVTLNAFGRTLGHSLSQYIRNNDAPARSGVRPPISIATTLLVVALVACNIGYFLPRQIELHKEYTGLPVGYTLDLAALYYPPMHNAIIVTGDYTLYSMVLFPLNDPLLHNDVIYALASTTADFQELQMAFPGRTLYHIERSPDGSIVYTKVA